MELKRLKGMPPASAWIGPGDEFRRATRARRKNGCAAAAYPKGATLPCVRPDLLLDVGLAHCGGAAGAPDQTGYREDGDQVGQHGEQFGGHAGAQDGEDEL